MTRAAPGLLAAALVLSAVPPPIALPGWGLAPPLQLMPTLALVLLGLGFVCVWLGEVSVPVALFVAWVVVRAIWSGPAPRVWWCVVVVLAGAAFYRWAVVVPARASRWLVGILLGIAGVQMAFGLLDVLGINSHIFVVTEEVRGRPHGLLYHPNHFGLYLALLLPPVGALMLRGQWWWGLAGPLAAMGAMVVLSRSRVSIALLGPTLAWGLWCLISTLRWRRAIMATSGTALLLGGLVLGLAANPTPIEGYGTRMQSGYGGRLLGWTVAAVDLADGPTGLLWIGRGLGTWALWALQPGGRLRTRGVPELALPGQNAGAGWWTEAHNDGLQVLFELGIIGAVLGALVLAQIVRDVGRAFAASPSDRERQAWALMAIMGLLASFWTPVFHHAALASVVVLAAARARG